MQRDRIAGVLGEHDRILADKRLADEIDALLAAVDDKNILIRGRDAARSQMLPQCLRECRRSARRQIAQEHLRRCCASTSANATNCCVSSRAASGVLVAKS